MNMVGLHPGPIDQPSSRLVGYQTNQASDICEIRGGISRALRGAHSETHPQLRISMEA